METTQMQTDETTLELSEEECAARVAPLWNSADAHSHYPADTSDVCEVLRSGGGFDVTAELLETWARSKQVGQVAVRNSKFAWSPSNMLRAASLANSSRRWIPLHAKHIHKMTAPELAEAQAAEVGATIFTDLDSVDFRSLVGVIQNTNEPELRAVLCTALQTKLKQAGLA